MIIATYNVNSVRQREAHLLRWLQARQPDIVCLQELKCMDDAFPRAEIEALGYNVETHGQKTFNGVAILSKYPIEVENKGLPGFEDEQARFIEAVISVPGEALRICGVYWQSCRNQRRNWLLLRVFIRWMAILRRSAISVI